MKNFHILFGIVLAFVLLTSRPTLYKGQTNPANDKFFSEKTFIGQLLNVDIKAKLISVRGSDQKETMFNFNDDTLVVSPDKSIQGLNAKPGAQLRIEYREERGVKMATRIELIESQ